VDTQTNKRTAGIFARQFAVILVSVLTLSVFAQPAELRVTTGSLAGATIKIISKDTVSQKVVSHSRSIVSQSQSIWPVALELNGQRTNLSATLAAYAYNVGIGRIGTNHPVSFFAMVIESNTEPRVW
jgi:hypothetical protein